MTASVHDSYYPIRTAVDVPYTEDYDPGAYEYNTPYLAQEELADVNMNSDEAWESEVQAYEEGWDSFPSYEVEQRISRQMRHARSKPADPVDYAEANHVYVSAGTMALIEMLRLAARRVNYNPPKQRMSRTVPVSKKEVPDKVVPQKPKTVPVTKMGRSIRIPAKDLPLYQYRGWKEMTQ